MRSPKDPSFGHEKMWAAFKLGPKANVCLGDKRPAPRGEVLAILRWRGRGVVQGGITGQGAEGREVDY